MSPSSSLIELVTSARQGAEYPCIVASVGSTLEDRDCLLLGAAAWLLMPGRYTLPELTLEGPGNSSHLCDYYLPTVNGEPE